LLKKDIQYRYFHHTLSMLTYRISLLFFFIFDVYTGFVTRLTRRVPLVEQEMPTLPEHPSSPPFL
jgi:hypothetical protein